MKATKSEQEAYNELSYYTLSHPDPSFIHQLVVDAHAAQTANNDIKSITITFALAGLYLVVEKEFSGKQVQLAHMKLAKHKKQWPTFVLPNERGEVTVFDVLSAPAGVQRDTMIQEWCKSVWAAYKENQQQIRNIVKLELGIE